MGTGMREVVATVRGRGRIPAFEGEMAFRGDRCRGAPSRRPPLDGHPLVRDIVSGSTAL